LPRDRRRDANALWPVAHLLSLFRNPVPWIMAALGLDAATSDAGSAPLATSAAPAFGIQYHIAADDAVLRRVMRRLRGAGDRYPQLSSASV